MNNSNTRRVVSTVTMQGATGAAIEVDIVRDRDGMISVSSSSCGDFALACYDVTKAEALAAANRLIAGYRERGMRQVGPAVTHVYGV